MSGTEILMNFHKQKVIDKDFYEGAWTFDEGFEKSLNFAESRIYDQKQSRITKKTTTDFRNLSKSVQSVNILRN